MARLDLRGGCCGFPMARPRYFATSGLVEVQHTFYQPARPATLASARAQRPSVIVFQCPASFAPTPEHVAHLRRFFRKARREAGDIVLAREPRGALPRALVRSLFAEPDLRPALDPFAMADNARRFIALAGAA